MESPMKGEINLHKSTDNGAISENVLDDSIQKTPEKKTTSPGNIGEQIKGDDVDKSDLNNKNINEHTLNSSDQNDPLKFPSNKEAERNNIKISPDGNQPTDTIDNTREITSSAKMTENESAAEVDQTILPKNCSLQNRLNIMVDVECASDHLSETSEASTTDSTPKVSRELKSLIDSAKESKIINESTQIKTKMRKSRGFDTSISQLSPNPSSDAGNIQERRESGASLKSNSSDNNEKVGLKRSMRSQNPEFVTKQQKFLNSVTGKENKESKVEDEPIPKKIEKKVEESKKKSTHDPYCWKCHWEVDSAEGNSSPTTSWRCKICPRSLHQKCLSGTKPNDAKGWVCPECINILNAENSQTRSPAMRKLTLPMLRDLLKFTLKRLTEVQGVEPFLNPVDRKEFPQYDECVVRPMDLRTIGENIEKGHYGSTDSFLADVNWILHNSIIFNSVQSRLTAGARTLVRVCRAELNEIEACPECYAAAHKRRPTWFTDVCTVPHILVWAKLKGFPFWPAKVMSFNSSQNQVDVRFFGAHDRAWVPLKEVYLYSVEDPNAYKTKRQDISLSVEEAELYIQNLSRKFGGFKYAEFKTAYDPTKAEEHLKMMLPEFKGELPKSTKSVTNVESPSSNKNASPSKTPKSNVRMDGASDEDNAITKRLRRKMSGGADIAGEFEENPTEASLNKDKMIIVESRSPGEARKRKNLTEAVATVVETPKKAKTSEAENVQKEDTANNSKTKKDSSEKESEGNKPTPTSILKLPVKEQKPVKNNEPRVTARKSTTQISVANKTPDSLKGKAKDGNVEVVPKTPETESPKKLQIKWTSPKPNFQKIKIVAHPNIGSNVKKTDSQVEPNKTTEPPKTADTNSKGDKGSEGNIKITNVRSLAANEKRVATTINVKVAKTRSSTGANASSLDLTKETPQVSKTQTEKAPPSIQVRSFARDPNASRKKSNDKDKTASNFTPVTIKTEPVETEERSEKTDLLMSLELVPRNTAPKPTTNKSNTKKVAVPEKKNNSNERNEIWIEEEIPSANLDKSSHTVNLRTVRRLPIQRDLNGNNSMVYIPIQPAPPKPAAMITTAATTSSNNVINASANQAPSTVANSIVANGPTLTVDASSTQTRVVTTVTSSVTPIISSVTRLSSVNHITLNGVAESTPVISTNTTTTAQSAVPPCPPLMRHPLNPTSTVSSVVPTPSSAGPVAELLNQNSVKLTDFFRNLLLNSLEFVDDPAATIQSLKLQIEDLKWKHQQEMNELRHNTDLMVREISNSVEKLKSKAIADTRRACEQELSAAVEFAKSRQWCANCRQEAQFYCCWNTSYCDYPCQQKHWRRHFATCKQTDTTNDKEVTRAPLVRQQNNQVFNSGSIVKGPIMRTYNANRVPAASAQMFVPMNANSNASNIKYVTAATVGNRLSQPTMLLNHQLHTDESAGTAGYLIIGGDKPQVMPQNSHYP